VNHDFGGEPMSEFETVQMPVPSEPAPDGSRIYPLVRTEQASVGIIELRPDQITAPVYHLTIEEVWYVLEGKGQLWRKLGTAEETVDLTTGTCVTIPNEAAFQFRSDGEQPLRMLMLTIPPWPGPEEAVAAGGAWTPGIPD
jgi:mannose-6-phosphate isomerase-like protein (cupin superfamily)